MSKVEKHHDNTLKYVTISMVGLLLMISPFFPNPETMEANGWSTLAIVFFGITLWFTNIVPPAVTSMIIVVLFPLFGILTFDESAASLGSNVIWLIIAMLILGTAVENTGLSNRLVYSMFSRIQGDIRLIIMTLILVAFILTFFIPNAIGRVSVLLPITQGIIKAIGDQGGKNVGKSLMLVITYTPVICTVALMTGATGSVYAASLFHSMLRYEWNYLYWMVVMIPVTLVILFVLWLIIIWKYPVSKARLNGSKDYFHRFKENLGPMSKQEKTLLLLYIVLILLWVTQGIHHLPISMSAVLVVILLFVPGINIIEWKNTIKNVDWGVPLLFAAGLTMATAFQSSGVVNWATTIAVSHLSDLSPLILSLTLMVIFAVIRIGFTNLSTTVASLMPVALTFALGTPFNPIWVGMICIVASSMGYLFPSQSIGTMITYSLGYFTAKELFNIGFLITISTIVVTILAAFFYWPLIGLTVY